MQYELWPSIVEPLLDRLNDIARHEFPIPQSTLISFETAPTLPLPLSYPTNDTQPNSNKENDTPLPIQSSPPQRPPVPSFSSPTSIDHIPDSQPATAPSNELPPPLLALLASIQHTLRTSFPQKPPHTVQRLSELILRPKSHYKTLPAYLRAVDRVVSVSSGADIFPLPVSTPSVTMIDGTLINGINGTNSSAYMFNDSALGSDESLGGALLTPIPWLHNSISPPPEDSDTSHMPSHSGLNTNGPPINHSALYANEHLMPERNVNQDIRNAGEDLLSLGTVAGQAGPTSVPELDESDEIPYARGPTHLGVEDLGLQDGKGVSMSLSPDLASSVPAQDTGPFNQMNTGNRPAGTGASNDGDDATGIDTNDDIDADADADADGDIDVLTTSERHLESQIDTQATGTLASAVSNANGVETHSPQDPAKIDKLSILGVRSFDNTRSETIQFHTPLTLIVGYNGSGKTTIIECLKYATTGDLPPNSKGGAFIHDPKLCGEKEVFAQVKLAFRATSSAKMVVTRSLQLTVKKLTRQQKTLDGQLLMVKEGERTAISSRVAELDQIMPQYLGVSKAILDSVIFCHQDESLWPMSEPSVLKKKFDEIFEALKYTKAIDNIKALRKKQNEELGKYKIMEQHARDDKDKADRAEKRSVKLQEEIEALRAESHLLSKEMRRTAELADKAWKESESYAEVLGALEGKRIEARSIRSSISNIKQHLVEVDESDEWLRSTLEQFESRQLQYKEQEESSKEKYLDLKELIEQNRHQLGFKQSEQGKHVNDKAHFERQVERRSKLIKEIARQNSFRGFDDDLDEMQIADFMERMQRLFKERNQALEKAKRDTQTGLKEAQTFLNQLSQRKAALQEAKNSSKRQIALNDKEAAGYQSRLNDIDVDEGFCATLESRIEEVENNLQREKEKAAINSWEDDIEENNAKIRYLEDESAKLNTELIQGTKKAGDLARLDHLKGELKDRERSLETMTGAHGDRISKLISQSWTPGDIEQQFQNVLNDAIAAANAADEERTGVVKEFELVDFRLKNARKTLPQHQKEVKKCANAIYDATGDEPLEYSGIVKQRQTDLDLARKDADQYSGLGEYLTKCLEAANDKKVCRTCSRPFKSETDFQLFKKKLEGLIKRATVEGAAEAIQDMEEQLENVRAASSYYDTWIRLTETDIPALEKEISQLESQYESLLTQMDGREKIMSQKMESRRDIESISKTVATITRYDSEIKTLKAQIQELSAKQEESGSSRTLEDIQDEIATIGEKTRQLKKVINKLSNDRDQSRATITKLELRLRDVRSELDNAKFQLEKKATLAARVEEYRNLNMKQREDIEHADEDIENLAPEISKAQAKYDDISVRGEQKERELQKEVSALTDSVYQLELANEDITSYNERGGPAQLERSKREVQNLTDEIGRLETEQTELTRELNNISARLKDSENTKRQYSDNLRYRQETEALSGVNEEIGALEAQNAEVDRSRFKDESERNTREYNALAAKQASKMGEMKSKDDQLMQLLADWNTDYKDAAVKFKEAHIKVETTKAAVDDLGRYGGALDKAIMKYHGLKMEEINRIIGELWQKTYRGTDVDTILIRSDNENSRGNRSYNYRVCMVKQDAEMDMRGRCSAGQKVLASIIIRLALAECFGVNCGLIALDEPTTNLDRDNIRSLAESLHDIINTRRQQANFQLIVITHDEEFLRHMQCGDFCDYYYRVSRNERQKSVIERQSIAEVL
ncbi:DNA repair protein rad50 [Myotisia sp. PD_48]|nr:DNA repair protein rad50 [Myotisia sp. PD_48]